MLRLAVAPRQRLVRDALHEVLEEPVLSALRRTRIGLDGQHLLADQRREEMLELRRGEPADCREGLLREGLAEDRRVLDRSSFPRRESVQTGGDEGLEGLRNVERVDGSGGSVHRSLLHEEPAVQQHANGLDRVQRDALGAVADPRPQLCREPGHEPLQQLVHGVLAERFERQRRRAALRRAPVRPLLEQLRAARRHHVQRRVSRPLQQILDEVEQ